MASIKKEIRQIRDAFAVLSRSFGRLGSVLEPHTNGATPSGRKKPQLSAKQHAALKLQGEYMGTMRGLSVRKRARVKRVRAEKGIRAAIKEAKRLSQ